MDYSNYKGAIFDCDGTLLDSMGMWKSYPSSIVKYLGLEPVAGLDEHCMSLGMDRALKYIMDTYNLDIDFETLKEIPYKIVEDEYFNKLKLKKGTKYLLENLKNLGYKMVVATATPRYLVVECLKREGVLPYFLEVYSVKDYDTTKKDPKIFEVALERVNLSKNEVLVFEDDANPINTCLKASFNVVGVEDIAQGESFNKVKPYLKALINLDN